MNLEPASGSKWDKRYLDLVELVASWSRDPSTKFGCVIVDSSNVVVSLGYNGFSKGFLDTDDRWQDRDFKLRHVIHAEENALLHAPKDLTSHTLYINMMPCSSCMGKIAQKGVMKVVCYEPTEDYLSRWSIDEPLQIALECGVQIKQIKRK